MRVCNYLEGSEIIGGGLKTSWNQQIKALRMQGLDVTISPKDDFDILHLQFFGPKSFVAMKKAKANGKPVIIHAHTTKEDIRNSFLGSNLISPLIGKYLKYYYNKADLVLTPSEYSKNRLENYPVTRPIRTITNGVDTEKFSPGKLREDVRKIIAVGYVLKRKDPKTFVEVARSFPERDFIWYGKVYKSALTGVNMENLPPNVTFTGYFKNIAEAYSSGDIFLFPSKEENQGIVILEAAACGLPIIVRDIPTYRGWLRDGENCLKCKSKNEFKSKLEMLIENGELRRELSRKSLKLAKEHSLKRVGEKLESIYEKLLE